MKHWIARICSEPGCGAYACYGFGVFLLRGIEGRWFCPAHRPANYWTFEAAPRQGQLL